MVKNKINCLIITVRADHGGGPEHVYQLIKNTKNENIVFFVACPNDAPYWQRYTELLGVRKLFQIAHRKINLLAIIKLVKFAKKNNINLIHTHGKGAGLVGRLVSLLTFKQIPCVHTPHGIHTGEYRAIKKQLYIIYEQLTSVFIQHIFFVSQSECNTAQTLNLWPHTKHNIVYNGVASINKGEQLQRRLITRKKLGISDNAFCVAMFSRFDYAKNMQEAYAIAKQLPAITFLWVGDGEDKGTLENLAETEQLNNIFFIGLTDKPADYLAAADIYLNTSRWEGLSLGILEAMAHGLPVVASDVVGNNEAVMHKKTGLLYPPKNIKMAVMQIKLLKNDVDLYKQYSANAFNIQQSQFEVGLMTDNITNTYFSVNLAD